MSVTTIRSADAQAQPGALAASRAHRARYYAVAWIVAATVVFAGFAPRYFLRAFFPAHPLTLLVHGHGALMSAWFLLFLVQVRLVANYRLGAHRRLGTAGAILAALIVVVGVATAIEAQRLGHRPPGVPVEVGLYAGVVPLTVFGGLVAAAVLLRRRPGAHRRLMLLATLAVVQAAAGRLPLERFPWPDFWRTGGPLGLFSLDLLVIYMCAAWDTWRYRRLHQAFAWGLAAFLTLENLLAAPLANSNGWRAFTDWITH